MGANSHNALVRCVVVSILMGFEKEIYASLGPRHPSMTVTKATFTADPILEISEQEVKVI